MLAQGRDGSSVTVGLASVVADDAWGRALVQGLEEAGVDASRVKIVSVTGADSPSVSVSTATYTAIHGSDGELVVSAGDFSILKHFDEGDVEALESSGVLKETAVVIVDGNYHPAVFAALARAVDDTKSKTGSPTPLLAFEPTSDHKCTLPIDAGHLLGSLDIVKPNLSELMIMLERAGACRESLQEAKQQEEKGQEVSIAIVEALASALYDLMSGGADAEGKHVIVSMGRRGVVWARAGGQVEHVPLGEYTVSPDSIQNTNGCGDAFCAGLVLDTAENGGSLTSESIKLGFESATAQLLR